MKRDSGRMQASLRLAAVAGFLSVSAALSQISINVAGYAAAPVNAGYAYLANPFDYTNNSINYVMPLAPDGTRAWLWNVTNQVFDPPSQYSVASHTWSLDLNLSVGRGFVVNSASPWTNYFVGSVLEGALTNFVMGGNKFSLLAAKVPQSTTLAGHGFPPSDGDNAYIYSTAQQKLLDPSTYFNGYGWYDAQNAYGVDGPTVLLATCFFVQHSGPDKEWVRTFFVARPAGLRSGVAGNLSPQILNLAIRNGLVTLTIANAAKGYNVQFSPDRVTWATIATKQSSPTWQGPLPPGPQGFFQVIQP